MKRTAMLGYWLTLGMCVFTISSCTSDELVLQYSPQAQLLLEKSREFAQKYGVDMLLNEEYIEETAQVLTVEKTSLVVEDQL